MPDPTAALALAATAAPDAWQPQGGATRILGQMTTMMVEDNPWRGHVNYTVMDALALPALGRWSSMMWMLALGLLTFNATQWPGFAGESRNQSEEIVEERCRGLVLETLGLATSQGR